MTVMTQEPTPQTRRAPRERVFAWVLIALGAIGWYAAFALTVDRISIALDPNASLDCNISVLVQCGKNLESWQGALLGFPNPILGLGGFVAPIAVGVAVLAGGAFTRWLWIAFNAGIAGAMGLVIWLISQSIFVLGTLCPWCMLTWSVVIPLFLAVTIRNLSAGVYGSRPTNLATALKPWIVPLTVACYLTVALIAQLRLDVLNSVG